MFWLNLVWLLCGIGFETLVCHWTAQIQFFLLEKNSNYNVWVDWSEILSFSENCESNRVGLTLKFLWQWPFSWQVQKWKITWLKIDHITQKVPPEIFPQGCLWLQFITCRKCLFLFEYFILQLRMPIFPLLCEFKFWNEMCFSHLCNCCLFC